MPVSSRLPTPLGVFTLIRDEAGLTGLAFPDESIPGSRQQADTIDSVPDDPLLAEAGRQLLAYLKGALQHFDLPLSIHGTSFQRQVWQQLQAIPYGQTRSYGELAEHVGGRHKARAVGGAAHANPLAIIIPCHRLIGSTGALTGFGGGLTMKQKLLALEGNSIRNMKRIK